MILASIRSLQEVYSSRIELKLDEFSRCMSTRGTDDGVYDWFPMVQRFTRDFLAKLFSREKIEGNATVLDPFLGSGNVLITCLERGLKGWGIEASPLFWFISHVKTSQFKKRDFDDAIALVRFTSTKGSPSLKPSDIPTLSSFARLFEKRRFHNLLRLREEAMTLNQGAKELLLFALASELLSFSHAERNGKGLHLRMGKRALSPRKVLLRKLEKMKNDYEEIAKKISKFECYPLRGDSRDFSTIVNPTKPGKIGLPFDNVDFVVSSPPYCNSADYIEMYKLEHWFLNFVRTYDEFKELSYETIRSHCTFPCGCSIEKTQEVIEDICSKLNGLRDKKVPQMIRGYFDDMHSVLTQIRGVLRPEGKVFLVIGNSCYGGIPLPTDLLLADIARNLGFQVEKITVLRQMMTSGQQWKIIDFESKRFLRESVLTLRSC